MKGKYISIGLWAIIVFTVTYGGYIAWLMAHDEPPTADINLPEVNYPQSVTPEETSRQMFCMGQYDNGHSHCTKGGLPEDEEGNLITLPDGY